MIFSKLAILIWPGWATHIAGTIGIFTGLLGIGFLIGFHELGHFLFAKIFQVDTPVFSIGFGPRILTKKIGNTEFSLSAIPLGGYVQMAGMGEGAEEQAGTRSSFSFAAKPFYQKLLIMSGGILFNLLFAYLMLIIVFMVGMPQSRFTYPLNATTVIEMVGTDTPAQKAGVLTGDKIESLNGKNIDSGALFYQEMKGLANKTVMLGIERNGERKQIELTPLARKFMGMDIGFTGIMLKDAPLAPQSLSNAIKNGINLTNKFIHSTLISFKYIMTKLDIGSMAGPLTIITESGKESRSGFSNFFIFLAIISINLAILNLIPLPILDGGQILFYSIEALIGRSVATRIKEYIFIATWIFFLLLFIYLTYKDFVRIMESCGLNFKCFKDYIASFFTKLSK